MILAPLLVCAVTKAWGLESVNERGAVGYRAIVWRTGRLLISRTNGCHITRPYAS